MSDLTNSQEAENDFIGYIFDDSGYWHSYSEN